MALAVIYGLAFATVLTLIIVPVLYSTLEEIKERMGRLVLGTGPGRESGTPAGQPG